MTPQTEFVLEYFNGKRGGFFVDVGAYDGILINNTVALQREYDWSGLCIEPNLSVFPRLQYNRQSKTVKCLNLAAFNQSKIVEFSRIEGYSEMLSGIEEAYDPRHLVRLNNEILDKNQVVYHDKVAAEPLSKIFYDNYVYSVDYLSIDTEGSEIPVLEGIDFSRVSIKLISFEDNFNELPRYNAFMSDRGFRFIKTIGLDHFFEAR